MALMTVFVPYCSADHSADGAIFRLSTAFTTVRALYYAADHSADGSRLLNLPLVDGLHDGLPAVLLSGWQ